jgi:hypothetical protein
MDEVGTTKVRMLRRFLEKIEHELRIVLSEEESKFKTDRAKRELENAEIKHSRRAQAHAMVCRRRKDPVEMTDQASRALRRGAAKSRKARSLIGMNRPAV